MKPTLWCVVCGSTEATVTKKAQNALPAGVNICAACKEATGKPAEVGIVRLPDGTLHITDGRKPVEDVS